MSARTVMFGLLTVLAAGICVRLGVWQLDRLTERRTKNALVLARRTTAAVSVSTLRGQDTSVIHWRHVTVHGVADYGAELLHATRSQSGSVGVHLLTPVRPLDGAWGDTAIVVIRGFVNAPDGRTIDFAKARDADTLTFDALVTEYPPPTAGAVRMPSAARDVRVLDRDTLQTMMHRPLAPFVLLALGDTVQRDVTRPTHVPPPSLSEGPHQSYAYQWFAFATVFCIGFVAVARSDKRRAEQRALGH
jgi:surfeit locus 1 family protein